MTTPGNSLIALALTVLALLLPPARQVEAVVCARCGWRPPAATRTTTVKNAGELQSAVAGARNGETILIEDGDYALQRTLEISAHNVTLRSRSGDPDRVVLHGRGMVNDSIGVAVAVGGSGVTIADITIRNIGFHAVQVRGERGASRFTLHNAKLYDAGQQLLKGSTALDNMVASEGLVACSEFGYTTSAPSNYTDGVDILNTRSWTIRDNRFLRIRGPQSGNWNGGPAILAWQNAEDTIIERNLIVDSYRGIALGLGAQYGGKGYDHLRGIVRNNVLVNLNGWADEALEANGARDARIEHNTVLVEGQSPWSISVRFATSTVDVRNNLSNRAAIERNGGKALLSGNVTGATRSWFVNPPQLDLRLAPNAKAIDAGVNIADVATDFDRAPRPFGKAPDAGAFEFPAGRAPVIK